VSLRLDDVSVRLGGADILDGVSFDVADREVVAVLGPSGSGKTTLLRVVAGLQDPSSGRVLIDGRDVTDVPTHRRGVGLMFQDHALFPHRDVAGNVAFGLRMARERDAAIRARVEEVLELVGLGGFGPRSIENLSGGERQRVALARALAPRPSLLLLDEPLGSLDRALRDRLLDELAELLRATGVTVVHVTHDQAEAFATGERIVVVRSGRIAQIGRPEELWRHPVDAGVARIVGPAGLVPVEVAADGTVVAPWGVVAVDGPPVPAGAAVLVLRPDDVEVVEPGPDAIPGRIARRAFRGDHVLVHVLIDGAPEGGSDAGSEVPVVDRTGTPGVPGDPIAVRLRPGAGALVADIDGS
jgi:thiamine transport system ATP-binding protein